MIIMLLRMSQRPQSGGNQEAITKQSRPFRPVQVVVSVHLYQGIHYAWYLVDGVKNTKVKSDKGAH